MITIIANGKVDLWHEEGEYSDSGVTSETSVKVHDQKEFTYEKILHEGHPNIDAFAVDTYGLTTDRVVSAVDLPDMGADTVEIDDRTVSIKIRGTADGWIDTAEAYASERPETTVKEALETFKNWTETEDRDLQQAIDRLED